MATVGNSQQSESRVELPWELALVPAAMAARPSNDGPQSDCELLEGAVKLSAFNIFSVSAGGIISIQNDDGRPFAASLVVAGGTTWITEFMADSMPRSFLFNRMARTPNMLSPAGTIRLYQAMRVACEEEARQKEAESEKDPFEHFRFEALSPSEWQAILLGGSAVGLLGLGVLAQMTGVGFPAGLVLQAAAAGLIVYSVSDLGTNPTEEQLLW